MRRRNVLWLVLSHALVGAVVWVLASSPRFDPHAGSPESFEITVPGRGPDPVRVVPVMEDTGTELRPIAPVEMRVEMWRVTTSRGGRSRTYLAQPR